MSRPGILLVLVTVALMVMQAVALLRRAERQPYHFWSGVLTILIASSWLLACWLFAAGEVVVIPPFGIMVVQGNVHFVLRAFLLLLAVATSGFVQSVRAARDRQNRARVLFAIGLLVGVFAATSLSPLDTSGDKPLRLYVYDLWSPPLLCWICVAAIEWALVVLQAQDRTIRASIGALAVTCAALAARLHPPDHYFGAATPWIWRSFLQIAWPVSAFSALRGAFSVGRVGRWLMKARWFWRTLNVLFAMAGLASLLLLAWVVSNPTPTPTRGTYYVILAVVLASLGVRLVMWWRQVKRGQASPLFGIGNPLLACTLLLALLVIVAVTADIFYFRYLPTRFDLAGVALAAVIMIEVTSEGPLVDASLGLATAIWGDRSFLVEAIRAVHRGVVSTIATALAPLRKWAGGSWIAATLGKVLSIVLLLSLLDELPNRGKTLIYPFNSKSIADAPAIGEVLAERVANTIGGLMAELRPEMLVLPDKRFDMVTVAEPSSMNSAFEGDWLTVGTAKVPVGVLVSTLKAPLQSLFGARIVAGTVQKGAGGYELLVGASTGETWHETAETVESTGATGPASMNRDPASRSSVDLRFSMADTLAYRIVSSDRAWTLAGMTRDPKAFEAFHRALAHWRTFESASGYEERVADLQSAIKGYREAIQLDPQFALAHYRLGLALREDRQPGAAVSAFESAAKANPRFGAALVAQASTLFDFDLYSPSVPLAMAPPDIESNDSRNAYSCQAQGVWQKVLSSSEFFTSPTDRGSAYLGLCRSSLQAGGGMEGAPFRERVVPYVEAYYFCARAEAIYASLAPDRSLLQPILLTRAGIINEMAVALLRAELDPKEETLSGRCHGVEATVNPDVASDRAVRWTVRRSQFNRPALPLLDEAHRLAPDDLTIGCNWAAAHADAGDPGPLEALLQRADVHVNIGDQLSERTQRDQEPRFLPVAMNHYDRALRLDPSNIDAMSKYAYLFWLWRRMEPRAQGLQRPLGRLAEQRARMAARLAEGRVSRTSLLAYQSTLGEVLLAQGRPHEAIGILENAVGNGKNTGFVPQHTRYDEIRWDLAQAYECADLLDGTATGMSQETRCRHLREKAAGLYEDIRNNERQQPQQNYSRVARQLTPDRITPACTGTEISIAPDVTYVAARCKQTLEVESSSDSPKTAVHIWGPEVDGIVGEHNHWRMWLAGAPLETHLQYFAQLVSSEDPQETRSPVYWFPTHNDPQRNLIRISFRRAQIVRNQARLSDRRNRRTDGYGATSNEAPAPASLAAGPDPIE